MNDTAPLAAVTHEQPCGPSLEYDTDYLLLFARLEPRAEVQYGSFVGAAEIPDWSAIEREAERLLSRSLDIALLVCQCRAATRLRRGVGLAQSLRQLLAVLLAWPEAVHPQLAIDGVTDPGVRANALAALADPDGLLGDAAAALAAWSGSMGPGEEEDRKALCRASAAATAIDRWASATLGEYAPSLQALLQLLAPFEQTGSATSVEAPRTVSARQPLHPVPVPLPVPVDVAERLHSTGIPRRNRDDMRAVLADAAEWFETHEPSSPVALLLHRAERMVGLPYSQLVQALPAEWLQACDAGNMASQKQVSR